MSEAKLIRACLLGLPVGLVLLTAGSMAVHFTRSPEDGPPQIIRDLADDITTGELKGYVRNLSQVIGPRHLKAPATMERTANYIESTLGPRNIGYVIHRQEYDVGTAISRNVWVQIPGGKRAEEVVIVAAHYDSVIGSPGANNNATGIATLFALAQNFVDETPKRTLRFVAFANGLEPIESKASGPRAYAKAMLKRGDRVAAILCLDGLGAYTDQAIAYPGNLGDYLSPVKSLALIGSSSQAKLVRATAKTLTRLSQSHRKPLSWLAKIDACLTTQPQALSTKTACQPYGSAPMGPSACHRWPTPWIKLTGRPLLQRCKAWQQSFASWLRLESTPPASFIPQVSVAMRTGNAAGSRDVTIDPPKAAYSFSNEMTHLRVPSRARIMQYPSHRVDARRYYHVG